MRRSYRFILTALLIISGTVCALYGLTLYAALCAAAALISLFSAWRSVAVQLRTIETGTDMLKSQDFASRLRHVGIPEADRLVDFYNSLIDSMKAERLKVKEQDRFLSKLVEASPMGIAICDLDGRITSSNNMFRRLCTPLIFETLDSLGMEEQTTVRLSGNQILRCSRQYFMDRGFRRSFFLVEPLTDEIVKAETDVFHKIVRTIGHEVNNTLGGIVSVFESMAEIHKEDRDICDVLDSCRTSCLHLGEFVRGYSDVVKLPAPALEKVSLDRLAADLFPFLNSICPENISMSIERKTGNGNVTDSSVTVNLDPMLIQRVLINVVKNSVESIGGREGHIVLRTEGCSIAVCDDGPGISPEVAEKLFTPFFSTKNPDRGLGLMLISDILRRHNATFSLTTSGGVTTFLMTFPKGAV